MIDMHITLNPQDIEKLLKIPILVRQSVLDKAFPAMAKPIMERASQNVPRSSKPGKDGIPTRDKWSKSGKVTKNFNLATWSRDESGDHIGYRVRKTPLGAYMKVGARSPRGNKQRFNQFKFTSRKVFYWGRYAKTTYEPPYRFMQRAFDETISQQHSAFNNALTSAIASMNFG